MHTSTLRHSIFLAGMLTVSFALADPALVKCVEANGKLTLTNEPCEAGALAVPIAGLHTSASAAGASAERAQQPVPMMLAARGQERYTTWARNPAATPKHSLDVATLQEARMNLQKADQAWQSRHSMRIASAN